MVSFSGTMVPLSNDTMDHDSTLLLPWYIYFTMIVPGLYHGII